MSMTICPNSWASVRTVMMEIAGSAATCALPGRILGAKQRQSNTESEEERDRMRPAHLRGR